MNYRKSLRRQGYCKTRRERLGQYPTMSGMTFNYSLRLLFCLLYYLTTGALLNQGILLGRYFEVSRVWEDVIASALTWGQLSLTSRLARVVDSLSLPTCVPLLQTPHDRNVNEIDAPTPDSISQICHDQEVAQLRLATCHSTRPRNTTNRASLNYVLRLRV